MQEKVKKKHYTLKKTKIKLYYPNQNSCKEIGCMSKKAM